MAIIFSYPPIKSTNVNSSDKLIISQMNTDGNPTKTISISELSKAIASGAATGGPYLPLTAGPTVPLTGDLYMAPNGAGPSVGSKNIVFRGIDDLGNELDGGRIFTQDSTIAPSGQDLVFQNADDNGVLQTNLFLDAFGQVGIQKTNPNFGLDVGGSGNFDTTLNVGGNVQFGGATDFRYFQGSNSIGLGTSSPNFKFDISGGDLRFENNDGIRFGGTGSNNTNWRVYTTGTNTGTFEIGNQVSDPRLTIYKSAVGTPSVEGKVQFNFYGSGNITGTAAYNLEVDANGNIIETATGGGATFTAANSEATPHIVLGASAQAGAPAGGADGVYICASSFGSATSSDEQINIGRNNDTNGTQSVAIGIDNSATVGSPYGLMIGKNNTTTGTRTWAIGEGNDMGTPNTATFGLNNSSSFTGGVSSGGLMNLSVGNGNEVDCDKAIVLGWSNDLSGSFGWTLGGGKEVVVIGTRFSNTLLGPNRSGTDRTGPRVIIGTGSALAAGGEEKRNSVEYYQPEATHSGIYNPALYNSASYADDVAAAAGGVGLGELYRNGSVVQIRMT